MVQSLFSSYHILGKFHRSVKVSSNKGLEIGSCPIKMVDNLSSQVDFLFNKQTKIII